MITNKNFMRKDSSQYKIIIRDFVLEELNVKGYHKFTLDTIAQGTAISKKTIYKIFTDKEEIVRSLLTEKLNNAFNGLILLLQEKSPMIQKIYKLSEIIEKYIFLFNEESLANLKKEFPNLWKEIVLFRKQKVIPLFYFLLNHAKKHNLIADYSNELIIKLFSSSLDISIDKNFLTHNKYSQQAVFRNLFDILVNGLLTKKGKKLLAINKRMKNENN